MLKFHEYAETRIISEFGIHESELIIIEKEIINDIDHVINEFAPMAAAYLLGKGSAHKEEKKEDNKFFSLAKVYDYIKKAIKALGIVSFMGAMIYIGFRFDAIRRMFPFLAPFIDKIGSRVYEFISYWTGNFGYNAFMKLVEWSKEFAMYLVKQAAELFGVSSIGKKAKEMLDKTSDIGDDVSSWLKGGKSQYDNPSWTQSSEYMKKPTYDDAGKLLPKEKWEPYSYDSRSIYGTKPKIDTHFSGPEGLADKFKEKPWWVDELKNLDKKKQ